MVFDLIKAFCLTDASRITINKHAPPQSGRIFNEAKPAYYIQLGILCLRCPKGNKQPSFTVS